MKKKRKQEEVEIGDDFIEEDGEGRTADRVSQLRKELAACQAERREYLEGWQRARADIINSRKAIEREREDWVRHSSERIVTELIPVLDSFDMAMQNTEVWEKVDTNWRAGIEHIHTQLSRVLGEYGLAPVGKVGETFDPMRHEAVEHDGSVEDTDEVVVNVLQRGYQLHDKVIRPARVKVGRRS